jgi:bile acid:Na+ symporter, BASS family
MELINILLSITLFLIMVSIGSSIELKLLKKTFKKPKKLIIGLFLQIVIFPLFAFLIASISNLSVEYKIGLVILAACPGGTLSNFITYLIKGETALSVGLTSTNSLVILLTIPIYISLAFATFLNETISLNLPIFNLIFQVFLLVIFPVLIGSVMRYKRPNKTIKSQKFLKIASSVLLALFFLIKFIGSESAGGVGLTKEMVLAILPWALLLNLVGLFLGFLFMKILKKNNQIATTMGIEIGLQNTVLALLITDAILLQPNLGHPILIYALFSFWTTLAFGLIFIGKNNN